MKKVVSRFLMLSLFLLPFCLVGCGKESIRPINNDILNDVGLFSVSATQKVAFAPGNLAEGGRSFVASQYQLGGYFGWGTGDHPGDTSINWQDYSVFHDWGDSIEGGWRTLSFDEWKYIVFEREQASEKYGVGMIESNTGLILLPDDWNMPEDCQFNPGMYEYERNQYSLNQWQKMEESGAVFLPAGGYRMGSRIYVPDIWGMVHGNYWLSTRYDEDDAFYIYFIANPDNLLPIPITRLAAGMQVRLVRNK